MPKFKKIVKVIEAEQFHADNPVQKGVCFCAFPNVSVSGHLHTIHNNQAVDLEDGDWIIPEPDGEHFYPCKPDIFETTYEPV